MAFPEQAAAFPIRRIGRGLQVCLIRRKSTKTWGIPKGLVDPGDTHREAALNEAWEEAGLTGRILGRAIGTYRYRKWGTKLTVAVFVMDVVHQERTWEESRFRDRMWTSFRNAATLLEPHPALPLLEVAKERVSRGKYRVG